MLTKLGLLLCVLGTGILCVYCTAGHSRHIQEMVEMNAAERVQAASPAKINVAADGRDVTLTGNVASNEIKQQAGDAASSASGVRTVDNRLVVVPASSALASSPDAKTVQASISRILLDKRIEFETSHDVLLAQSIPVLNEVLTVLKQAPQVSIKIDGYTDSMGDPDSNRDLSKARAEAVAAWFAAHGISKTRMTASGFGSDKPIATNSTAAGRFANRRVEIITN